MCACSNAIKFTHEGSVTIIVRVVPPPPPSIERAAKNVFQATIGISATAPADYVTSSGVLPGGSRPNSAGVALHQEASDMSGDPFARDSNPRLISVQSTPPCRGSEVAEEFEDTVWLHCEVTDSGIGIPGELVQVQHTILLDIYIYTHHMRLDSVGC